VTLDPKTSRRIFELARDQQDELAMPDDEDDVQEDSPRINLSKPRMATGSDEEDDEDYEEYETASEHDPMEELVREALSLFLSHLHFQRISMQATWRLLMHFCRTILGNVKHWQT